MPRAAEIFRVPFPSSLSAHLAHKALGHDRPDPCLAIGYWPHPDRLAGHSPPLFDRVTSPSWAAGDPPAWVPRPYGERCRAQRGGEGEFPRPTGGVPSAVATEGRPPRPYGERCRAQRGGEGEVAIAIVPGMPGRTRRPPPFALPVRPRRTLAGQPRYRSLGRKRRAARDWSSWIFIQSLEIAPFRPALQRLRGQFRI